MMIKKDFPLKDNGQKENVVAAKLYYELGSTDYWSGKPKPRGYYLSLVPMAIDGIVRSYSPLGCGGGYTLLAEVPRRSKARDAKALDECQRRLPELMDVVLRNTGYELCDGVALSMV